MREKKYVCPTVAEFRELPIFDILLKELRSDSAVSYRVYDYPYLVDGGIFQVSNREMISLNDIMIQNAHISNITDDLYGIELSVRSRVFRGLPPKEPDYTYFKTIDKKTLKESDEYIRSLHPEYHPKNYYHTQNYPVQMHYGIDIRTGLMTCINDDIPFEIKYCQTLGSIRSTQFRINGISYVNMLLIYDGNFNYRKTPSFSIFSFFKK